MTQPIHHSDERLNELESRVAFQDHTLAELNDVITAQERRIARLETEITALKTQMKTIAPSLIANANEETPPPHY